MANIATGATATVNCTKVTSDTDSGSVVFNAAMVDAAGARAGLATAMTVVRGRVAGTVTDANGPVAGVWVVAINGGVRSATRTNAAGQYIVGNLPAGTAYLEFPDPAGTHAFRWYHNDNGSNPTGIPLTAGQNLTGINETLPPYP